VKRNVQVDIMFPESMPVYVISVAAQLSGLHPQTLRQYDRLGLVSPDRSNGRNRLYSARDIYRLREVARLSEEGVSLVGIVRILELEEQNQHLVDRVEQLSARVAQLEREQRSTALVVWRP
jgi:MerR family transcriptional regulator, heat shock protein HspR